MISKIVFIVLVSMFSNNLYAAADQQPVDEYVTSFVRSMKPDIVMLKNNQIQIYDDFDCIKTFERALLGCGILMVGVPGIACILFSKDTSCKIFGAGMVGLAAMWANMIVQQICNQDDPKKPYFLLTDQGFMVYDRRFVDWSEVENVSVDTTSYVRGAFRIMHPIRSLIVTNQFRSKLFAISEDDYFPISFDNFTAIFEHYWNKSRDKVSAKDDGDNKQTKLCIL